MEDLQFDSFFSLVDTFCKSGQCEKDIITRTLYIKMKGSI